MIAEFVKDTLVTNITRTVGLQNEWQNVPRRTIQNLVAAMRRCCTAVIAARGGHNRHPIIDSHYVTHFSVNTLNPEWGRLQLDNTVTI